MEFYTKILFKSMKKNLSISPLKIYIVSSLLGVGWDYGEDIFCTVVCLSCDFLPIKKVITKKGL